MTAFLRPRPSCLLGVPILLVATTANATYSIVAADQSTQQVGGSVTSCVAPSSVASVYGPAPGKGGINAQAASNAAGRAEGVRLLNMNVDPAEIIRQITAPQFDPNAASRQYGIADLQGRAAGFTGTSAGMWRGHRPGNIAAFAYSIQGNILTSMAVIDQAETAFRTKGCDLADRLMFALEAGAENGEGDSRCTMRTPSIPSNSASIEVDLSGAPAGSYLKLAVSGPANANPLPSLRTMFNTWRATHPCMGPPDGGVIPDAGPPRDAAGDSALSDARPPDAARDASGAGGSAGGGGGGAGAGGASAGSSGVGGSGLGGGPGAGGAATTTTGGGGASTTAATTGTSVSSATTTGTGASGGRGGSASGTTGTATSGASGSPGTGGSDRATEPDDVGCSCRVPARPTTSSPGSFGVALALIGLGAARRRRRAAG